jgi:hypothetical protein
MAPVFLASAVKVQDYFYVNGKCLYGSSKRKKK